MAFNTSNLLPYPLKNLVIWFPFKPPPGSFSTWHFLPLLASSGFKKPSGRYCLNNKLSGFLNLVLWLFVGNIAVRASADVEGCGRLMRAFGAGGLRARVLGSAAALPAVTPT